MYLSRSKSPKTYYEGVSNINVVFNIPKSLPERIDEQVADNFIEKGGTTIVLLNPTVWKEAMSKKVHVFVKQRTISKFLPTSGVNPERLVRNISEKIPFQGPEYLRGIRNSLEDVRKPRI